MSSMDELIEWLNKQIVEVKELPDTFANQGFILGLEVTKGKATELNKSEWVSVSERLPEHNQIVLAYRQETDLTLESTDTIKFGSVSYGFPPQVTHWQPLPTPPINQ